MCNAVHFSTTSKEDLTALSTELFRVHPISPECYEERELLQFPQKWYLECRYGGCSCYFRHAGGMSGEPGFRLPTDDDDDVIESTHAVYDLFVRLLSEGFEVDVIDAWDGDPVEGTPSMTISLSEVGRDAFSFQEEHRLVLRP